MNAHGIVRKAFANPDDPGGLVVATENIYQQAIYEHNAEMRKATEGEKFGEFRRVASIPLDIFYRLKKEGILDDKKAFRKWLMTTDEGKACMTFRGM